MAMHWEDQLRDIVSRELRTPTFQEWLQTTGYAEMPKTITSFVQVRSIMRTLYLRYQREHRKAA